MKKGVERVREICHRNECDPKGKYRWVEVTKLHYTQSHEAEDIGLLVTGMIELDKEEQTQKQWLDIHLIAIKLDKTNAF